HLLLRETEFVTYPDELSGHLVGEVVPRRTFLHRMTLAPDLRLRGRSCELQTLILVRGLPGARLRLEGAHCVVASPPVVGDRPWKSTGSPPARWNGPTAANGVFGAAIDSLHAPSVWIVHVDPGFATVKTVRTRFLANEADV